MQRYLSLREYCENDLEHREFLLKEWDYNKNKQMTPDTISYGSAQKVWWKCEKDHEWKASITYRSNKLRGCPKCQDILRKNNPVRNYKQKLVRGQNDLATLFPQVAEEWNYTKNTPLTPRDVLPGSNKKVRWICRVCGYEWQATVNHRTAKDQPTGCPKCAMEDRARQHMQATLGIDDFATSHPDLIKEWDYEKNYPVTPEQIKVYSNQKYYWICPVGHSYKATAGYRSCDRGCPVCTGKQVLQGINDIATTHPDLVQDWDYEANGNYTPFNVTHGSDRKIHWKCHECGHKWIAALSSRSLGTGCPKCGKEVQTSFPEQAVFYYIKQFFPDALNSDIEAIGLELDIYIPSERIAVEYDGLRWHSDAKRQEVEKEKNNRCREKDILLIRIREDELEEYEDCAVCINVCGRHSSTALSNAITEVLKHISNTITPDVNVDRDAAEIYSQYITREKSLSLQHLFPDIAKEWHSYKNGTITPEKIRSKSNKKFWWKCSLGHDYYMSVNDRTGAKKSGCPYCAGRKVLKGFNDLMTNYPEIASEWNYEQNDTLTPEQVTSGSSKKVWWTCYKCGKVFQAAISSRIRGTKGCKECNLKEAALTWTLATKGVDDLATIYPEIAKEWDYDNNKGLTPEDVKIHSQRVIWWKCSKCSGRWQATVNTRSSGCGCPYCAGKRVTVGVNDLATIAPEKIKLWDYEANAPLKPENIIASSHKVITWRCEKGHTWKRAVREEIKSQGCPTCLGKPKMQKTSQGRIRINQDLGEHSLVSTHPELCVEWDYEKNDEKKPSHYSAGSHYKAWWKCNKGHSWQANISSRALKGRGCPYCSGNLILTGYNDFATKHPELLKEWDYSKNTDVHPEKIGAGSNLKVWWKCSVCGNEFKSAISGRSSGRGCFECGRRRMGKTKKIRCVETGTIYNSVEEAATAYDIIGNAISACARGESKTSARYHWEYV